MNHNLCVECIKFDRWEGMGREGKKRSTGMIILKSPLKTNVRIVKQRFLSDSPSHSP